jgi:hypothetical protein
MLFPQSNWIGRMGLGAILFFRLLAADIYVTPSGSDHGTGEKKHPLATIAAAQQAARRNARRESTTVHVAPGTYYLPAPLVFDSSDSGTRDRPVTYVAEGDGPAILSGGTPLHLSWQPVADGVFRATLPVDGEIDQLWIDGKCQWMARFPNRQDGDGLNIFDTWTLNGDAPADPSRDPLLPARIARWSDPSGGFLHALHPALWGGVQWRITGKKPDGTLALVGGTQNNRGSGIHPLYRMVENVREELDAPGEWYFDRKEHLLYFYPPPGINLASAKVEIVRLRELIAIHGTSAAPVRFLSLTGFTLRHTARTFMETQEPLLRSDWTIHRGGAIFLTGAEDCQIRDCHFDQVGGNTVFISGYNRRVQIRGCRIENSGASGVLLMGEVRAVRSPLLNYDSPLDYAGLDRTPGPLTDDYPADCLVEDCLITRTGRVEKQTAGIAMAMARRITIRHCSIYDVPRAGINLCDGCWGGHVIEFCDVFDTVQETGDHGSWNSWGRDRYWHPDPSVVNREVALDPKLVLLDAVEPITLRNNRWRCDHGWDVDLDDGSSHYRIYSNLFLNGGLKLREGYDRRVWNNITVNNSLHPHVWFKDSGDMVVKNIWMGAYQPALMPEGNEPWGRVIDDNLFATTEQDRDKFRNHGCDRRSVVGDPKFLDPSRGNFQVADDSPALTLGFKNFPMDQFGVQEPRLKRLAKTPRFSPVQGPPPGKEASPQPEVYSWLGMKVRAIAGAEFSAFGAGQKVGGIAMIEVPPTSEGGRAGILAGDLLLRLGDGATSETGDFIRAATKATGLGISVDLTLLRQQKELRIQVEPPFSAPQRLEGAK